MTLVIEEAAGILTVQRGERMRWMMLWQTDPHGMRELIRLELKKLTPIPEGVKFLPEMEFVTQGGLWITFVEAERAEPLFVWAHSFLHLFTNVRIEPVLTFQEWIKLCPAIEERARPQIEEAKRISRE